MNRLHRRIWSLLLVIVLGTGPVLADCTLSHSITVPPNPATETAAKHAYGLADGSQVFLGQLFIDADGAPKAYHRDDDVALDNLSNAGEPGNWWALATNAKDCGPEGKPAVQSRSDPAPGFYVVMTSMVDSKIADCRKQRKYVDATKIPYVALSKNIRPFNYEANSGALALVVNTRTGKRAFAIFADQAPDYGFGEGSIALGKKLGLSGDPKTGGTDVRENLIVVFAPEMGFTRNVPEIEARAKAAFVAWGGEATLNECLVAVKAAKR
jgi:Fungal chitosanase of glycosyl hydrolase group 75